MIELEVAMLFKEKEERQQLQKLNDLLSSAP
jgi:hypothetical protein